MLPISNQIKFVIFSSGCDRQAQKIIKRALLFLRFFELVFLNLATRVALGFRKPNGMGSKFVGGAVVASLAMGCATPAVSSEAVWIFVQPRPVIRVKRVERIYMGRSFDDHAVPTYRHHHRHIVDHQRPSYARTRQVERIRIRRY